MFFDQLKRMCEARGLKVTTTVKAAGPSTGLIGNWKNGGKPTYDTLCRLADYLGVSVQELVDDESREAKPQERNELTEYLYGDCFALENAHGICSRKPPSVKRAVSAQT